jgi:glutamate synthase (NADPH/NADH) large chain
MTGGVVVVLRKTGRSFAAGMSGGVAFVFNDDHAFERQCNTGMVAALEAVEDGDDVLLSGVSFSATRDSRTAAARRLLASWSVTVSRFVRVMPTEYKRALEAQGARHIDSLEIGDYAAHRSREQRQWA